MKQSIRGLAAAALLLCSMTIGRAGETMVGRWEGSVQIPDRELTLVVDLAQGQSGAWAGSIIIPGFDVKGKPLSNIVVRASEATFAIKGRGGRSLEATFKTHLNNNGMLTGDFVQAGNTAPLVLKRTGPPQVEPPPRSTAVSKELEGEWIGQFELFGLPRKVIIKLFNRGAEGAAADFAIMGKKTTNLPVDLVTKEGDALTIDSHETGISYEGRFNKESAEIKGAFIQGAIELPLVLHRTK
jgi:hypothetical protein